VQPRWPERVSISESPASDKRNRYGSAVTNGRSQRWQERDPWGLPVECAEDVWEKKAQQHPEIVANEEAIRAALRNPDALYYDPDATAGLRNAGLPEGQRGAVMRYVGPGAVQTTHGLTPMLISIAVKVLPTPEGHETGYVRTIFLTYRLPSRLQLQWSRPGWRLPV